MESQYWTVTVKFERTVLRNGKDGVDKSERISVLWAQSGKDAIKMCKALFYDNEPTLVKGTEKFTVESGRLI
jgi:hypothetical protein